MQTASHLGSVFGLLWPFTYFSITQGALRFPLVIIALACIIVGAAIRTTAPYIVLVAVAAPALASQ